MREIRKSGSEGGGAHKLSLPLSHSLDSRLPFHPFRRGDAEQVEHALKREARRLAKREPCLAQFRLLGQDDAAVVVEAMVGSRQLDRVGRQPMHAIVFRAAPDFPWEVDDLLDEREFLRVR